MYLPNLFVVEGADCVGKTFFCNKLIDVIHGELGLLMSDKPRTKKYSPVSIPVTYAYGHLGPIAPTINLIPGNREKYYDPEIWCPAGRFLVQDRLFMSDYIYGGNGGANPMSLYSCLDLLHKYADYPCFHIVLVASDAVIKDRYVSENELFSLEEVLNVNKAYAQLTHTIDESVCSNILRINVYKNSTGLVYAPEHLNRWTKDMITSLKPSGTDVFFSGLVAMLYDLDGYSADAESDEDWASDDAVCLNESWFYDGESKDEGIAPLNGGSAQA